MSSDPLRTEETPRTLDAASDADRDARIEQLLLAGLDHYFAAHYELAINVWTRALFFDRSHARARAYIERARSALAEHQRESEELLQSGAAAFRRSRTPFQFSSASTAWIPRRRRRLQHGYQATGRHPPLRQRPTAPAGPGDWPGLSSRSSRSSGSGLTQR
jgi:hypothetical protein